MKAKYYCLWVVMLMLGIGVSPVRADDTEIYFLTGSGTADEPMVMFYIDWRPNLTSTVCNPGGCSAKIVQLFNDGFLDKNPNTTKIVAFDLYRAVLRKVLPTQGVKIGLMVNHENGGGQGGCSGFQTGNKKCSNGGFIPFGFESMDAVRTDSITGITGTARARFLDKLARMPLPQGNASHKLQPSEMYFELYRYLTGGAIENAHNGYETFDPAISGSSSNTNLDAEFPTFSWDTRIENAARTQYVSPLANVGACANIYTVNIIFGTINQDSDADTEIKKSKANGGMGISNLPNSNNARFVKILETLNSSNTDLAPSVAGNQNVTSFFMVPAANNTENSFATAGGTGPRAIELSDDPDILAERIGGIFKEILSLSTTFVSASVPVNVFNRAEILDNFYLALFQPQTRANWPGNLKKLRLDIDQFGNAALVDALGNPAIASDGRIKFEALTFWTNPSALPFPDPNVTGEEKDFVVDGKDGRFVPRGAQGQQIPGINGSGFTDPGLNNGGARKLFTEPTSGAILKALNADTQTATDLQTALNAATTDEALCLLMYARGYDIDITNPASCPGTTTVRPWLQGDPLHSRPMPINYGGSDPNNPRVYIAFGDNGGFFRMIRNTDVNGTQSGREVWAFMPRKVMPIVKQLAQNNAGFHPYGVDGAPNIYLKDANGDGSINASDGDKVWVFFGLRRGGSAYYALDITNPESPSFLWKIENSGDFAELGLSFSVPQIGEIAWNDGTQIVNRPVLFFGGGYDTWYDSNKNLTGPATLPAGLKGRAIFVVDAETGQLVWKAVPGTSVQTTGTVLQTPDLRDSIPSNITVADSNGNGLIDRAYVGTLGGDIVRADFPGANRQAWTLTRMLSVGRHAGSADRRFFHPPALVFTKDESGFYDGVVIASGDRANPLEQTIGNELYLFKDRNVQTGSPTTATGGTTPPFSLSDLADLTNNCPQDDPNNCNVNLFRGWRIALEASGEKGLSAPAVLGGTIFQTTYVPPSPSGTQCGPAEGGGRLYSIALRNAAAVSNNDPTNDDPNTGDLHKSDRFRELDSGGIPSEVVFLATTSNVQAAGTIVEFVGILPPDLKPEPTGETGSWKTFWFQDLE